MMTDADGWDDLEETPAVEDMRYPMQCRWCWKIHDGANAVILQRYTDCSVWECPHCHNKVDDRPRGWGGSAFPVELTRQGRQRR